MSLEKMVDVARACVCGKETDLSAHEGYYCSTSCALSDTYRKIVDNTYFSHYEHVHKLERRHFFSTSYRHVGNVVKATQTLKGHGYMSIGEWEFGNDSEGDDFKFSTEVEQTRVGATSHFEPRRSSSVSSIRPRFQDRSQSLGPEIASHPHSICSNGSTFSLPEYATWPMSYSSSSAAPSDASIPLVKTPSDIQVPLRRRTRRRNALFVETLQRSPLDAIGSSPRVSSDSFLAIPQTTRSAGIEDLPKLTNVPSAPSEPTQSPLYPPRRRQRGRMVGSKPPGLEIMMKKPCISIDQAS